MKLPTIIGSLLATALLASFGCGCATSQAGLAAQAKIARADAEKIALTQVAGGTVKEGELEKEKGKLVWSFDIATPGTQNITEILVDAMTGAVVAKEIDSPADQEKEKQEKSKEKK
jgi:hypothetical protein